MNEIQKTMQDMKEESNWNCKIEKLNIPNKNLNWMSA
jgi:hypothetical protein